MSGSGFLGPVHVYLGTVAASRVTVSSASRLTAIVPRHAAGAAGVSVRTAGGTSRLTSASTYTFRTPPTISSTPPPTSVGRPYTTQLTTLDGRAGVWSLEPTVAGTQALPPGVELNGSTIAGTPRSSGPFRSVVTVTDTYGLSTSTPVTLEVSNRWGAAPVPMPPDVGPLDHDFPSMNVQACTPAGLVCVGGGHYQADNSYIHHTLWVRDSGVWTGRAAPLPADAWSVQSATMLSATCSSINMCAVLGTYLTPDREKHPLLWTYRNGTWDWTLLPMPERYNPITT